MKLIETMLGRLGSRFTLHFLPREKVVRISPLGKYYDRPFYLSLGLEVNGETRVLPFCGPEAVSFSEIEMALSMTSVTFHVRDRVIGLAASFRFISPFYPRNEPLCLAPFFYLEVSVEEAPLNVPVSLIAGLAIAEGEGSCEKSGAAGSKSFIGGSLITTYSQNEGHWGPSQPPDSLSGKSFSAPIIFGYSPNPGFDNAFTQIEKNFVKIRIEDITLNTTFQFQMATYLKEPVLEVKNELHLFKYTRYFSLPAEIVAFALAHRTENLRYTLLFDDLISGTFLDKGETDFIAFTFQSYLPNTWWTYPQKENRPTVVTDLTSSEKSTYTAKGQKPSSPQNLSPAFLAKLPEDEWFSVWEGNCTFHSTVDVEYNLAWVYLLFWPELLEKTINQWQNYFQDDERGTWMSHDIGGLLGANCQVYPHQMEVEENCNFILLVYILWRFTGRFNIRSENLQAVKKLIQFVLDSDTTGNGFPDRGTANTVDDASPAVQFGREQIYLAVKALSACWAASLLLEEALDFPDTVLVKKCRDRVTLINRTLNEKAWLEDHFSVTLDRVTDGLIHPWTGQPLEPAELEGWNAYSIYTSNGLLFLLAGDAWNGKNLPPVDYNRFRKDITETIPRSLLEYGCTHSSLDRSHIWISQNLHRDFVAAYLGEYSKDMVGRYWAFEQYENSTGRGGCFVDTYGGNHLRYYPRGITSIGILYALAGVSIDRNAGRLTLKPVKVPLRIPLPTFADWPSGKIPWAYFKKQEGKVILEIENGELLSGVSIELVITDNFS